MRSALERILADIRSHQRYAARLPVAKERKRLMREGLKALDQLLIYVDLQNQFVERTFINVLLPTIGEIAGIHGLELLAGEKLHFRLELSPGREPPGVARASSDIERFRALEEHLRPQRMSLAEQVGPVILKNLFEKLADPLLRQLEIEKADKGGRPQDLYRNFLIQELAATFEEVQGQLPTAGKTGDFVRFCHTVFDHVGLDADGLEEAVARILRNRRRRTG